EPEQYRRFVEQRYPLDQQLSRVNGILQQIEIEIESRAGHGARDASCEIPVRRSLRQMRRATP
ncbi:MAG TPA: hypothetical protein PLS24_05115, partial [Sedimentisphaerales bacterium]|nr:hypothetical protein [Sedimentisphaerales bacterium]